ncbi:MAG: DUF1553 domain-containing protein [Opitutae bacterium]|nr:DUF1553 domain-containing protein [Opitutae bacterium]
MRSTFFNSIYLFAIVTLQANTPLHERIDGLIREKAVGHSFSGVCDDATFLRRVTLDLTGNIPTAGDVLTFLKDQSPNKRKELIDRLITGDLFADHWMERLSVMLLERLDQGKVTQAEWGHFLKQTLREEPLWDVMVRHMIKANGKGPARSAMKFLGTADHHAMTENVSRLLLGMDLTCAKCHDHPSVNEWKQAHYWGLFAYLNQTRQATHKKEEKVYLVEGLASKKVEFESVFDLEKMSTGPRLPNGGEVEIPQFEKGKEYVKPAEDGLPAVPRFRPREQLAEDLTSGENSGFVRNSVNRIWFLLLGRGLSHPLDQMHGKNPPSHPKLLELLAHEFVSHDFNLKWLLREIMLSKTYQRSSRLPEGVTKVEPASYRVTSPKGLTPEQLLRSLMRATGNTGQIKALKVDPEAEKFDRKGYFTGSNVELPPSLEEMQAIFIQTFGQPPGEAAVDFSPGVNKSLFLMNDRLIQHWLKPLGNNLVARLGKLETTDAVARRMYLSVLSRLPEEEEKTWVNAYLEKNEQRRTNALGDLAWALLNSAEFRFNH